MRRLPSASSTLYLLCVSRSGRRGDRTARRFTSGTASTVSRPLLASFYNDMQQCRWSDECRAIAGRAAFAAEMSGVGDVHQERSCGGGDVPSLVEESGVVRTFDCGRVTRDAAFGVFDHASSTHQQQHDPSDYVIGGGVDVRGFAFPVEAEVLMVKANRKAADRVSETTLLTGLTSGGVPLQQLRRVWMFESELLDYNATVCPLLPNSVVLADDSRGPRAATETRVGRSAVSSGTSNLPSDAVAGCGRSGGSVSCYRTTLPWIAVRLFQPFHVRTRLPLASERVVTALRRWSIKTSMWWSVWGTPEDFRSCGFEPLPEPITLPVVDEYGDYSEWMSAYSCTEPHAAIAHVMGGKSARNGM